MLVVLFCLITFNVYFCKIKCARTLLEEAVELEQILVRGLEKKKKKKKKNLPIVCKPNKHNKQTR
jgi:hypothetical protein